MKSESGFSLATVPTKDSLNTAYLHFQSTTNSAKKRPCPFKSLALRRVSAFVSIYVVLNLLYICVWNSTLRLVKGGLHCKSAFSGGKGGWFRGVGRHTSLELEWVPLRSNVSGQMEEGGVFLEGTDLIEGRCDTCWMSLIITSCIIIVTDLMWHATTSGGGQKLTEGAARDWDETKAGGFLTPRTVQTI